MMARELHTVLDREPLPTAPARPPRRRPWLVPLLVCVLLAQMAVAMVTTAVQQTPTIDEPVYVATAADYLHEHRIRYNPEHPPLGKLVVAAGLAFADPHYDPSFAGDQGQVGRHLLYESGNDPWRVMLWARLPVIVLTLAFGLVAFAFARDLMGPAGGLVALALYAFSPDLIAHGSLATLDVPAAGFLLTSVWLLWRARRRPRLYVPLAGVAAGAALATKMSTLAAVPVLLALAAWSVWRANAEAEARAGEQHAGDVASAAGGVAAEVAGGPAEVAGGVAPVAGRVAPIPEGITPVAGRTAPVVRRRRRALLRALAGAVVVALGALVVVWASYLAVDPLLRWSPRQPVPAVHGLRALLVDLLPFPEAYRDGMRVQFGFEDHPWQGFLFGRLYTGSLWYYLPAALLVKTPLGMLALWAAGAVAVVAVRRLRPAAPYLLVPTAVLLGAAMTGSRDFGTRYAIFVPMFLAVAAAGALAVRWRWAAAVAGALVLFVAGSSLRTYPFYLPYSNEAFGGPDRTHLRLHDSNVDWGQDLGRLADRLRERYPGERVWLVYKGAGVPSYYGVEASDPREARPDEVRGLLVVSDSAAAKATGRLAELIDSARSIDHVGHSITVYRR
jgi:4-amino-4-deoxy-L-arabinose transferase-like glycosyltransferase